MLTSPSLFPSALRRRLVFALAAATLAGLPTPALARRGRRVRMSGRGLASGATSSGPALSREEVRSCISLQNAINQDADAIDAWSARFESEKLLLDQYERVVSMQRASLDPFDTTSVDAYNLSVRIHQGIVQSYNMNLPSFNQRVADQNSSVERFNLRFTGKAFFESDMQAVLAGR